MASPRRRSARVGKRRLSDGGEDDVCAQERKGGEEGASPPVGRPRIDVATVFTASPAAPVSSTELQVATALVQEDAAPSSAAGHETASTLEARSGSATAAGPGPQPLDSAYDAPVSHVRVDAGLPTSCAGAGGEESAPIPSRNGKKARRKHKKKKGCVSEDKLKKVLGNYDR